MVEYESILEHPFEKVENPQSYLEAPYTWVSTQPHRHILGITGGNEVSGIQGNRIDLESDLRGITRPNTWSSDRKHLPPTQNSSYIERKNPKNTLSVNVKAVHLPSYQMFAMPATIAPLPLEKQSCMRKEKY